MGVCGDERTTLYFAQMPSTCFVRQFLSLVSSLHTRLSWLDREPQEFPCSLAQCRNTMPMGRLLDRFLTILTSALLLMIQATEARHSTWETSFLLSQRSDPSNSAHRKLLLASLMSCMHGAIVERWGPFIAFLLWFLISRRFFQREICFNIYLEYDSSISCLESY